MPVEARTLTPLRRAAAAGNAAREFRQRAVVSSLAPQLGAACRVLVLGTAPSRRSLELGQSYAHPRNLFWPFMGTLYGAGPELDYAERIARLHAAGVGLWDVLKQCERAGSLDNGIRAGSEVPNDIAALLDSQPGLRVIALNGSKAHQVFARRIAPTIDAGRLVDLEVLALPSTSPANAAITHDLKWLRWRELLRWSAAA